MDLSFAKGGQHRPGLASGIDRLHWRHDLQRHQAQHGRNPRPWGALDLFQQVQQGGIARGQGLFAATAGGHGACNGRLAVLVRLQRQRGVNAPFPRIRGGSNPQRARGPVSLKISLR